MNILLIEDQQRVAEFVVRGLKSIGWTVTHFSTAEETLQNLMPDQYDVILLDLQLPGMRGQDFCKKIRNDGIVTPVLMLSGFDSAKVKAEGLDFGADDYLTKPFEFIELVARIKALHRRGTNYTEIESSNLLEVGDISVNQLEHTVKVAGNPVELTLKEREILILLMTNIRQVYSREHILSNVWLTNEDPLTNVVDVYIGRLRKKLDSNLVTIRTIRGVGYSMQIKD